MRAVAFLDTRARDGSRHFLSLPETSFYTELRDHFARLPGATVTGFVTDEVTEAWLDFEYRSHRFAVNNVFGEYWFFVADPGCPEWILDEVAVHAAVLLEHEDHQ